LESAPCTSSNGPERSRRNIERSKNRDRGSAHRLHRNT
jgi:hypothetical protein